MICKKCGNELRPNSVFCDACGSKVERNHFCGGCGKPIPEGVVFCSYCGKKIGEKDVVYSYKASDEGRTTSTIDDDDIRFKTQRDTMQVSASSNVEHETHSNDQHALRSNNAFLPYIVVTIIGVIIAICIISGAAITSKHKKQEIEENKYVAAIPDSLVPRSERKAPMDTSLQYAYMSDEWNVYIAVPVSETVLKIECWEKGSSSDKSLDYDYEVGTYRITDDDVDFYWIDEYHLSFVLTFEDSKNSSRVPEAPHVFTVNVNSGDVCKGTDYNEAIACYTYMCDDWHMYRAIPLTDNLVKIECWHRSDSFSWTPFLYGYDVCLIDINDSDNDFEWGGQRTGITITMWDPENATHWEEESLVGFTLENEGYQYSDVASYLGFD